MGVSAAQASRPTVRSRNRKNENCRETPRARFSTVCVIDVNGEELIIAARGGGGKQFRSAGGRDQRLAV